MVPGLFRGGGSCDHYVGGLAKAAPYALSRFLPKVYVWCGGVVGCGGGGDGGCLYRNQDYGVECRGSFWLGLGALFGMKIENKEAELIA